MNKHQLRVNQKQWKQFTGANVNTIERCLLGDVKTKFLNKEN